MGGLYPRYCSVIPFVFSNFLVVSAANTIRIYFAAQPQHLCFNCYLFLLERPCPLPIYVFLPESLDLDLVRVVRAWFRTACSYIADPSGCGSYAEQPRRSERAATSDVSERPHCLE